MSPLRGLIRLEIIYKAYKHFTATRFLMLDIDSFNPDRDERIIENANKTDPNPMGVAYKKKLQKCPVMNKIKSFIPKKRLF